jgi:hypothetical protein
VRELGEPDPPTSKALGYWEAHRDGGTTADEREVVAAIKGRVGALYGGARPTLKLAYGLHCAYCEVPISDYTDVEHVAPKSEFPLHALELDNFLPGCGICNTTKGNRPPRDDLAARCGSTDEAVVAAFLRSALAWPDGEVTTRCLVPVLRHVAPSGRWEPLGDPVGLAVAAADATVSPVIVDHPIDGPVEVQVHHDAATAPAAATRDLVGLDRGAPNDGRMALRTAAWVNAVAELRELGLPDDPPAAVPLRVVRYAKQTGFPLVWATVAEHLGWRAELEPAVLAALPGTDMERCEP